MVTITTHAPDNAHQAIVATIIDTVKKSPSITPRPKRQIIAALKFHQIALAFDDARLIGWLIATPYSHTTQEIGMAYIDPAYRNQGLLTKLIEPLLCLRAINLAVTYEQRIADLLIDTWHFHRSSLSEFNRLTQRKFALRRFASLASAISVVRHIGKDKPMYLLHQSHDRKH